MAENVVSFVAGKLGTLIQQEVELFRNIRKDMVYIKYEFDSIKALLKDADAKGEDEQGEQLKAWLKELRHVAFEIEDVLDEFLLRHHTQQPHGICGFVNIVGHVFKNGIKEHQLAARMQDIKIQVQEASSRRQRYNLNSLGQVSTSSVTITGRGRDPRADALFLEESKVVGIEKPRNQLIEWLLDDSHSKIVVVSVFGPGGLGKTTLVRKVYESKKVQDHFHCHAWVTVSQNFEMKSILRDLILQCLSEDEMVSLLKEGEKASLRSEGEKPSLLQLEGLKDIELKEKLQKSLQNKRYVIVLDDIWEADAWKDIKIALPDNECGSRIIVTTRSEDTAKKACIGISGYVYKLQPLEPDNVWRLFQKVAFKPGDENYDSPHLRNISQKFLDKCKGLPLAIVAIAGLLSTKDTKDWYQMYGDSGSLLRHSELGDVNTVLSLSYNDLSYQLKTCLLYFSVFPEDYPIRCSKLLRLWVAEGFVDFESSQGMSINFTKEQVAKRQLDELIARSLVQVEEIDPSGRMRTCRIHDLLHDFLLKKAQEQDFVAFLGDRQPYRELGGNSGRRLSVLVSEQNALLPQNIISLFSHARSLIAVTQAWSWYNSYRVPNFLSRGGPKLLKVLDLQDAGYGLTKFPSKLSNLFFLRYLSLRHSGINVLPGSVGKLVNLETLDLKETAVTRLPGGIVKLQHLRHLISTGSLKLPRGIGRVTTLERLGADAAESCIGEELGMLTQLRKLYMDNICGKDAKRVLASIEKMKYMRSLGLVGSAKEVLPITSLPRPLERLALFGKVDESCLHWIPSLVNLIKLDLHYSHLKDSTVLQGLQGLPNLVTLVFEAAFLEKELCFKRGGFRRLRHLMMARLTELQLIRIEEGAMPCIQTIGFNACDELSKVPIGMEHLTTLDGISLLDMPDSFSDGIHSLHKNSSWSLLPFSPVEITRREIAKIRNHAQIIRAAIFFREAAER